MKALLAIAAVSFSAACLAQATAPAAVPPASAIAAPMVQPQPATRWTAAQVREAFQVADSNGDGQLTRAEAQRLAIMPRSFEDTDLNKDGVLTLDEYQASFSSQ